MKAAIYNPYWDTLGGGERYTALVVQTLISEGYSVDIQWNNNKLVEQISRRFSLSVKGANVLPDIKRGDGYDICFWISDGSIPTLRSRNNILHFQFPFQDNNSRTLLNKMKLFRIKHVVCNSKFTKSFIDKTYGISSSVLYPPVDTIKFRPKRKENIILYVGRFSQLTQAKHQDVLIDVFKKFYDTTGKTWRLILAGGSEIGVGDYLINLRKIAEGYPVTIHENPSFRTLQELYGKAKFFWSASGYDIDELEDPLKVEHFGITVVEAMAAGCIPIVVAKGGHKEIVNHMDNGLLWLRKTDLYNQTVKIANDKQLARKLADSAKNDSAKFDNSLFHSQFMSLIN